MSNPPDQIVTGGMAEFSTKTSSAGGNHPSPSRQITMPETVLRHNISDDDLTILVDNNKEWLPNAFWCSLGISIGLLCPVLGKTHDAFLVKPSIPLTIVNVLELTILVVSTICTVLIWIVSKGRSKKASDLATDIKSRKRT